MTSFRAIGLMAFVLWAIPQTTRAQDRLVILSPHWDGIRYEFGNGFKKHYRAETGRDVEVEWMDVGGSSEILRFIKSEFKNKPDGIEVDVVFGGGTDIYLDLARSDLLMAYPLPESQLSVLPDKIGGYALYDAQYRWYGATMAGFGIVYNRKVLELVNLPEPKTWEDLTAPALFSWIGSADPRKSGSAHMPFEIILQAYGWERGWQIITAMGANARGFANTGSQVPKDVTSGEVAYGMSIDFYAWAQINEVGPEMIGYAMPDNLTIINPDPVGILKGGRNPETAKVFLRYLFTEEAQRFWMQKPGTPNGPEKFQLDRFAVIPTLYDRIDPAHTAV
ncbi:MAG: ABC transporter substrate-binding protein, partial [candidate division Zixibacteria bacterium]|nr:ABC transporter substrate-binding protein [candidate division Zixibacteria bacterium]